jgi:hypothetical protein
MTKIAFLINPVQLQPQKTSKAGLPAAGRKKNCKKVAISVRNPVLGLSLAFLGKITTLRAPITPNSVWRTRISEQNFYFTSIYMLNGDQKSEEICIMWLKGHTSGSPALKSTKNYKNKSKKPRTQKNPFLSPCKLPSTALTKFTHSELLKINRRTSFVSLSLLS